MLAVSIHKCRVGIFRVGPVAALSKVAEGVVKLKPTKATLLAPYLSRRIGHAIDLFHIYESLECCRRLSTVRTLFEGVVAYMSRMLRAGDRTHARGVGKPCDV